MNKLKELSVEKTIFIIFIIISLISIYADTLQQEFIKTKNPTYQSNAKTIFITALIISLLLYTYFLYRNYNELKHALNTNKNVFNYSIRTFGSILIVIATLCFIYFQLSDKTSLGVSEI